MNRTSSRPRPRSKPAGRIVLIRDGRILTPRVRLVANASAEPRSK